MTDAQHIEAMDAGEPQVANDIAVRIEVKPHCRCCGSHISTVKHELLFGSYLPFEDILQCLRSGDLEESIMRLLENEASAPSGKNERSKGGAE